MVKEIPGCFYNDPEMTEIDLGSIDILGKEECGEKWTELVSSKSRHLMRMEEEWPCKLMKDNHLLYDWLNDWNSDNIAPFKSVLEQKIALPSEAEIFFFWMKETGIRTTRSVFCRNWMNFLFEDEGCILVSPKFEPALLLSNGRSWKGLRSLL